MFYFLECCFESFSLSFIFFTFNSFCSAEITLCSFKIIWGLCIYSTFFYSNLVIFPLTIFSNIFLISQTIAVKVFKGIIDSIFCRFIYKRFFFRINGGFIININIFCYEVWMIFISWPRMFTLDKEKPNFLPFSCFL